MPYPALEQLMGAYLHQDFDLFGPTPLAVVDTFVRDEPDLGATLPREIEELLHAMPTEVGVKAALEDMGCQIAQPADDGGYRAWLRRIADRAATRARAPDGTSDA